MTKNANYLNWLWLVVEQGYYNESYYQDADPELAEAEEPGNSAMFDDEGVWNQKTFLWHVIPSWSFIV